MNKLINIGFFGNFDGIFKGLINKYIVQFVVFEENKSNYIIEEICKERNIKVFYVKSKYDIYNSIQNFKNIDLFVVASFGLIFNETILKYPKLDTINIHPGILPTYRGRHPLPQAILNKEKYMGITSHIMELEIDRGRILYQKQLAINYDKTYKYNEQVLLEELNIFILKTINNYLNKIYLNLKGVGKYYKPLEKKQILKIFQVKKLKDI